MMIATCHSALPASGPDGAPEWVHLVPSGTFTGVDGRGPYRLADPAAVIAASMQAERLPVDENHATDKAMVSGIPSPARGWIVEMQARPDGLWGRVEWNDAGRALMAQKAYRGISPVFTHDKSGTVLKVLRAALTNTPNLDQLETLHSTGQTPEMNIASVRQALGLPETADEAACLAAISANATAVATHSAQVAEMVPVAQVTALQAQLNNLLATQAQEKAVTFVDAAIQAGKPIAAVRDQMVAMHVRDAASAEALINGMPSIHAGGVPRKSAHDTDGMDEMMSAEDMAVCQKMGLDPKAFRENRKKMREGAAA